MPEPIRKLLLSLLLFIGAGFAFGAPSDSARQAFTLLAMNDAVSDVVRAMKLVVDEGWTDTNYAQLFGLCTGGKPSAELLARQDNEAALREALMAHLSSGQLQTSGTPQAWALGCAQRFLTNLSVTSKAFSHEEMEAFERPRPRFQGIGIGVSRRAGEWRVVETVPNGPADRAGMRVGDTLLAIDGVVLQHVEAETIRDLLRRSNQRNVRWDWLPPDSSPRQQVIEREIIAPASVTAFNMPSHTYLRFSQFRDATPKEALEALRALPGGLRDVVVLDLRGCGGGLLDVAHWVVALFGHAAPPTGWVAVRHRTVPLDQKFDPDRLLNGQGVRLIQSVPIEERRLAGRTRRWVILVNGDTAGGAVWVATSLKALNGATVAGEPTNRLSSGVDVVRKIPGATSVVAIRFETGKMALPDGRLLPDGSLLPDVSFRSVRGANGLFPRTPEMWWDDPWFGVTLKLLE